MVHDRSPSFSVGALHDAGLEETMIDAVIEDQNMKPFISKSFDNIKDAARWIDRQLIRKPVDCGTWKVMLFDSDSAVPFCEEERF